MAVVYDPRGEAAAQVQAHLRAAGHDAAQWYSRRDLADVDRVVRAGTVQCVVLLRAADLLEGLWEGQLALDAWLDSGVRIEFVDSPPSFDAAWLAEVNRSWSSYYRQQRRRQVIAGSILSIVALAAAFVLTCLAPAR